MNTKKEIEEVLTALGRAMALKNSDEIEVLCCGATALSILGIHSRVTKDVDILGMVKPEKQIVEAPQFPQEMQEAIIETGHRYNLESNWFNSQASSLLRYGLPEGTLERSARHKKCFGPCLTIRFLDRMDLVALKLFAAMGIEGQRHLKDLEQISPTKEEIVHGIAWMQSWESSREFQELLGKIVEAIGFPELKKSCLKQKKN